jgi:spermidine synthase
MPWSYARCAIKLAHRFFQLPRPSRLHTTLCDAQEFVDQKTLRFDFMIVDLTLDESIDSAQLHRDESERLSIQVLPF